jgi:hypothetical protein
MALYFLRIRQFFAILPQGAQKRRMARKGNHGMTFFMKLNLAYLVPVGAFV